jgi:hypothetical protein
MPADLVDAASRVPVSVREALGAVLRARRAYLAASFCAVCAISMP